MLQFAQETIAPLVRTMDDEQQFADSVVSKLFELGLMGIEVPEESGGAGGSFFDSVLAIEAISRVDPAVAVLVDVHNTLVINAIRRWASDDQKWHWLQRLAVGHRECVRAERGRFGSDAFALQTRAEKIVDGYRLNGRKLWISNAREAGLFLVFATLDPTIGYKGITAFLVEKERARVLLLAARKISSEFEPAVHANCCLITALFPPRACLERRARGTRSRLKR